MTVGRNESVRINDCLPTPPSHGGVVTCSYVLYSNVILLDEVVDDQVMLNLETAPAFILRKASLDYEIKIYLTGQTSYIEKQVRTHIAVHKNHVKEQVTTNKSCYKSAPPLFCDRRSTT